MTHSPTTTQPRASNPGQATKPRSAHRSRIRQVIAGAVGTAAIAVVAYGLYNGRATESTTTLAAPDFTLQTSTGGTFNLSAMEGTPVLLYFSEGAGCESCIYQMAAIEQEAGFAQAGIAVVPIVMDSAEYITAAADRLGVITPFLLDDGTVSAEYGTLGTGMHAGLPGHGFVLIDADGNQVWKGDYPSMWIEPGALLSIAEARLSGTVS